MKKLLSFIFLLTVGISAFAQKSYITMYVGSLASVSSNSCYLSGDVPSDMKRYYSSCDYGDILNQLSAKGYEVENMVGTTSSSSAHVSYLLSKKGTSNPSDDIQRVKADNDEEVAEVARFNLQGMPIGKNEKGIQIVVYSNYTTKTIIVE